MGKRQKEEAEERRPFKPRVISGPLKYQNPNENCWCPRRTLSKRNHSSSTVHPAGVKKTYRFNTDSLRKLPVVL